MGEFFRGLEDTYARFKKNRDSFAEEHGLGNNYTMEQIEEKVEQIEAQRIIEEWEKVGLVEKGELEGYDIDRVFEKIDTLASGDQKEQARNIVNEVSDEVEIPLNIGMYAIR